MRPPRRLPVSAVLLLASLAGCDAPIGAIRRNPPEGIAGRVVAARAKAPEVALEGTHGAFRLTTVLAQGPALLVFYRGHW